MVIITKTILNEFSDKHPDCKEALNEWYRTVKKANWTNLNEVKQTFKFVDYVGNERYVFNIKGNHYRLVAMIFFNKRTLFIRFIGTHSDYDKIDCKMI